MHRRLKRTTSLYHSLTSSARECDHWMAGATALIAVALMIGVVDAALSEDDWFPFVFVLALGFAGLVCAAHSHVLTAVNSVALAAIEVQDPAPQATWVVAGGLLFLFALQRPRLDAVVAGTAFAVGGVAIDAPWSSGGIDGGAYGIITLAAAMVGIGQWVQAQRKYETAEIGRRREESERRRVQVEQHVAEERLRIARDLHDSVAHHIAVVNVQTNLARASLPVSIDAADRALQSVQAAAREVLSDLQQVLGVLREQPPVAGEQHQAVSAPKSTPSDFIRDFKQRYSSIGLDVEPSGLELILALAEPTQAVLWRVIQESFTNAYRYGDGAVSLHISDCGDGLSLVVRNKIAATVGPRARSGGHGLLGMSERVGGIGGTLSAQREDHDFVVRAWVPTHTKGR